MLILTIKDLLYFERFTNHFRDPTNRRIDDLSETDADDMSGFSIHHLRALMIHLRIPDRLVVMRNRVVFTGEECLIIFLYEIRHGHTYTHMAKYVFGGDPRRISDMVRAMTDYLYTSFYHKISGNSMAMWCTESNITRFRRAIWNRLREGAVAEEVDSARYTFLNIPFENFRIFSHLDCMAHPTSRPGDESVTTTRAGENLVDPQRSFYRYIMTFVVFFKRSTTNILPCN
jgi:hypothetical protein